MTVTDPPPRQTCAPAKSPCGSCPYRHDAPSGVWAPEEYAKLPAYDRPTQDQPAGLFMCHQQDGRLCAGWVGCHDMGESLAVRLAALGQLAEADLDAVLDYVSPVPLWASGAEAAEHGLRDVDGPDARARRAITRLEHKATLRGGAAS